MSDRCQMPVFRSQRAGCLPSDVLYPTSLQRVRRGGEELGTLGCTTVERYVHTDAAILAQVGLSRLPVKSYDRPHGAPVVHGVVGAGGIAEPDAPADELIELEPAIQVPVDQ